MSQPMLKMGHPDSDIPFGREGVVREIMDHISSENRGAGSFSLVGPRFIGKSSVLRCLVASSVQAQLLKDQQSTHLEYFDCSELPNAKKEVFRVFGKTAWRVAEEKWQLPMASLLGEKVSSALEGSSDEEDIVDAFERVFRFLSTKALRIVLVLDHFEHLLSLLSESNIQVMRDIFANTEHGLVVATRKPIRELSPKTFPSKFYEIFKKYRMGAFTRDESFEFVHMANGTSFTITRHEEEKILHEAGYHPAFLSICLEEMLKEKMTRGASLPAEGLERIHKRARGRLSDLFLAIWSAIDEPVRQILFKFAVKDRSQAEIMSVLQRLEDEHGVVCRAGDGRFEIMGSLLQEFIESQTAFLDHLLTTDYYRAGLRTLETVREGEYRDTEPGYYYQAAYKLFTRADPSCDAANAMIRSALESLLDVMVKRSEQLLGQVMTGAGYKDKKNFVARAYSVEDPIWKLLDAFWELTNKSGPHPGPKADLFDTQMRLYLYSGMAQFLLNASRR